MVRFFASRVRNDGNYDGMLKIKTACEEMKVRCPTEVKEYFERHEEKVELVYYGCICEWESEGDFCTSIATEIIWSNEEGKVIAVCDLHNPTMLGGVVKNDILRCPNCCCWFDTTGAEA